MKKPKYTAEAHQRIVKAIRDGATQRAAARRVGVTPESLSIWKRKHPGFAEAVERAHAQAQVFAETSLYKLATKGNVRALVAWLQARRPEDWNCEPVGPSEVEQPPRRLVIMWPHEGAYAERGGNDQLASFGNPPQLRQGAEP